MKEKIKLKNADTWDVFNKYFLLSILFASIFILFNTEIAKFIDNTLIPPIFNRLNASYLIDFYFIIISIGIIIYSIFKIKIKYTGSFIQYATVIVFCSIYLFYRYTDNPWTLIKFKIFPNIAYLDFIFFPLLIYPICSIPKKILEYFKTQILDTKVENVKINQTYFHEDNPINNNDGDSLERKSIVINLAQKLTIGEFDKAFTVGIVGPWGAGKSSFMNLLEKQIKDDNILKLNFFPFYNHNETNIISDFFDELSNKLKRYNGNLSKQIDSYSTKLLSLYKNGVIDKFLEIIPSDDKTKGVLELYTSINEIIKNLDLKIIIFIDDIDRLNHKEIIEVFKLIRNTANFNNTIFIVSIDKNYIKTSLKNQNEFSSEKYIEKFFQLEVYLPEVEKEKLKEKFIELIKLETSSFHSNDIIEIEKTLYPKNFDIGRSSQFNSYILTLRDVIRFTNQFKLEKEYLQGDIDYKDFMNIIFLKQNFPSVYILLYSNVDKYLSANDSKIYSLRKKDRPSSDKLIEEDIVLFEFLNKNHLSLNITEINLSILKSTLHSLFPNDDSPYIEQSTDMSINRVVHFSKYFKLRLDESHLKNSDFDQLINITQNLISWELLLDKLVKSGKEYQIIEKLYNCTIDNKQTLLRTVDILFKLIHLSPKEKIDISIFSTLGKIVNIDELEQNNIISKELFTEHVKKEFFENKSISILARVTLAQLLYLSKSENKLWGLEEVYLFELLKSYFKEHLDHVQKPDWDMYRIFHLLKYVVEINQDICGIIKDFIKKKENLKIFCQQILDIDMVVGVYKLSNVVDEIFGSKPEFEIFVQSLQDEYQESDLAEFLDFMELQAIINYSHGLKYNFEKFQTREYITTNKTGKTFLDREGEKIIQIFFKLKIKNDIHKLINDAIFMHHLTNFHYSFHVYKGSNYLYISTTGINTMEIVQKIANALQIAISKLHQINFVEPAIKRGIFLKAENDVSAEVRSFQPPLTNSISDSYPIY